MDDEQVRRLHGLRIARLDPLLSEVGDHHEPPDDVKHSSVTATYRSQVGMGAALLQASFDDIGRDTSEAVWGPLRRHNAQLFSVGRDPERGDGVRQVLDDWIRSATVDEIPEDLESGLRLDVASRDDLVPRLLLERGFAPVGVRAVRRAGQGGAERDFPVVLRSGAVLRQAVESDVDTMGELDGRLLDLDSRYGCVRRRARDIEFLTAGIGARFRRDPDLTWVVEQDGDTKGYVHFVRVSEEHAYLAAMYTDPEVRGHGTGAEVMSLVHAHLDASGFRMDSLSYAMVNPRSGPFWCRNGYRPLTTQWQRVPAIPLL